MTEKEKLEQIAAWIRLTEEKLQSTHGESIESKREDGRGHRHESGIAAARELGIPKATATRAVAAESLPAEAKAIADEAGLGSEGRHGARSGGGGTGGGWG